MAHCQTHYDSAEPPFERAAIVRAYAVGAAGRNGRSDQRRARAANGRLPPVNGGCYILTSP
jgi:hypothetical protein